jgi:hypothetical protein
MSTLTKTEQRADSDAHDARTKILGFEMPRHTSRYVLRLMQALRMYPKA